MRLIRRAAHALTLAVSLFSACAVTVAGAAPARAQSGPRPYTNTVNTRFATVSNGPQSAVIVDVPSRATIAEQNAAVSRAVSREWKTKTQALAAQVAQWEKAGLIKRNDVLPLSGRVIVRKSGRLVVPAMARRATRSVGGGTLTFRYTGFSATDEELLRGFIATAYPRIVALYGAPAVSSEVEIVNALDRDNSTIPETRRFAFGMYDVTSNRILLPVFQDPRGTLEALLLNMIHAFHGPAQFQYDAWEDGFARAAASVILRDPIFNQQYGISDPSANALYSLLRFYDILNQPALGNSTFFPPSQQNIAIDGQVGSVAKMLWARMGMSGAAWVKVYIENPAFFRQFNEAYYQQFDPATNAGLAGNVPQLRAIAGAFLPEGVEGLSWNDWFQRQFALDTSIAAGTKLYAFVLPGQRSASVDDPTIRQIAAVTLVYYRTERSGDESLLSGQAYATYTDASNARLSLGASSEQAAVRGGEAPLTVVTTNSPGSDATRLTMDFTVGNNIARVYMPIGFDGDFQGTLLLNGGARRVTVRQQTVPSGERQESGDVEGAAFGVNLGTSESELGRTTITVSDGANNRTFRINTGDGLYYAVLRDGARGGGVVTLTRTFATSDGISGNVPYLVSLPLQPLSTNAGQALSLPGTEFLLSYWEPVRAAYETFQPDQPSVAPLAPGRGYWLKLIPASGASASTITVNGTPPPTDTDFAIACGFGWNLVGSPFSTPIDLNNVFVKSAQEDPIPWQDAVERSLVAVEPFRWDHDTRQYLTASSLRGEEWEGYWLRVLTPSGVTLLLPAPDAPTRARKSSRALVPTARRATRPDWSVRLRAAQTSTVGAAPIQTVSVTLGAAKTATRAFDPFLDQELPPAIVPGLGMEFGGGDLKRAGGRYVADFRDTTSGARGTWNVQIASPTGGPVTLTWEGLSGLPRTTGLTLVDSTTGERIGLRSRSHYTFTTQAGASRAFQIVAEPALSLPLAISNLTSVRTRGAGGTGLSIAYTVTRAADVSLSVSTIGGRSIRMVGRSRATSSGQQRMSWDGRAQDGSPLPPGPYAITLSARGENGETATVSRIVTLLQ